MVEIDPVVHEFAVKYFSLPPNHNAVITDAVSYTSELANKTDEKFDYIVHDVFTGGAEPVDLFTVEFISNVRTILKPGGVIAIVRPFTSHLFSPITLLPSQPSSEPLTNTLPRTTQATSSFPPRIS
jgi:spermidine synthase